MTKIKTVSHAKAFKIARRDVNPGSSLLLVSASTGASHFLPLEAPSIQISSASAKVCRKAQPAKIREHAVSGGSVDAPPKLRQVNVDAQQGHDVHGRLDGSFQAEVQWHPSHVQGELDCVKRRRVLGRSNQLRGGRDGAQAVGDGSVGGVAHQSVETRPGRPKHPWGRAPRSFFDMIPLGLLLLHLGASGVAYASSQPNWKKNGSCGIGKDAIWDSECGYIRRHFEDWPSIGL